MSNFLFSQANMPSLPLNNVVATTAQPQPVPYTGDPIPITSNDPIIIVGVFCFLAGSMFTIFVQKMVKSS